MAETSFHKKPTHNFEIYFCFTCTLGGASVPKGQLSTETSDCNALSNIKVSLSEHNDDTLHFNDDTL